MPITGAQRDWGWAATASGPRVSAFFTDTVQQLPGQVRDVIADPETRDRLHRMPAADAFRELERLLGLMQFTVLQAWGFGDEPAQAVYETIDTLATLPTDPDPADVNRAHEPSTGGFQRAFVEIERMALDFERRKNHEAMQAARRRREQSANVVTSPALTTATVRERPRERRDNGARRSSARAGPSDDDGPPGEPPKPWPLSAVDRLPLLWHARAARCRWHEWREGWPE